MLVLGGKQATTATLFKSGPRGSQTRLDLKSKVLILPTLLGVETDRKKKLNSGFSFQDFRGVNGATSSDRPRSGPRRSLEKN